MKLNLNVNVTSIPNIVIQFQLLNLVTPVSLPKLNPFPESTLIYVSIDFEIEPHLLDSHISLMGKECEIKIFLIWTQFLNQNQFSNPKLIFRVSIDSQTYHF